MARRFIFPFRGGVFSRATGRILAQGIELRDRELEDYLASICYPYASFHLTTGGVTGVSTTTVTLVLNATSVNPSPSKFVLAANEVTVKDGGDYEYAFGVYFNTGGTSRSEYTVWLEVDSVEVPGSRSGNYQRGYDSGSSSAADQIIHLTAGQVLRLRTVRTDGGATTGYQDDNGTRLKLRKVG